MATFLDLENVKAYLNMTATNDDAELQRFVDAACSSVERYKGTTLGEETTAEVFYLDQPTVSLTLNRGPILHVDTIENDDREWADVKVRAGLGRIIVADNDEAFYGDVEVTYTVGVPEADIPADYKHAALVLVAHLWTTQRMARNTARSGSSGEFDPSTTYSMPRRVQELLGARYVAIA